MNKQIPTNGRAHLFEVVQLLLFWLIALLITINELIFAFWNAQAGVILHFTLFWSLIVISYFNFKDPASRLYLSLGLIPLIRVISVSMPLNGLSPVFWYLIISVPLFFSALSAAKLAGLDYKEIGLTVGKLPMQLATALIGFPLGFIGYFALQQSVELPFQISGVWYSPMIIILCTGFIEEFIFRGVIYKTALEIMSSGKSTLLVSFINAVMNIPNLSFNQVAYSFLLALLFTKIYDRQESLIGVSLLHGIVNITILMICPHIF
jgi:membrane protease YdiL (CAAX protease family)